MRDRLEDKWTMKICDKLKDELDNNKYEISCFDKVPYSVYIEDYKNEEEKIKYRKYEVDLVIKEKRGKNLVPKVIIESKYNTYSTHDVITYSNKAKAHKELYNGLKYGFMIGNSNEKSIKSRLLSHGENFDFMFVFSEELPTDKEWNLFVNVIKRNLDSSNKYESIISDRNKKDKNNFICIEKQFNFYE